MGFLATQHPCFRFVGTLRRQTKFFEKPILRLKVGELGRPAERFPIIRNLLVQASHSYAKTRFMEIGKKDNFR